MNWSNFVNSGSYAALSNWQAMQQRRAFKPGCSPTHYANKGSLTLYGF